MQQKYLILGSCIALLTGITASPAQAFSLFIDNRTDFNNSFTSNSASTIVDSNGAFGADEAIATALPSLTRSGNINGEAFSYDVFDVNFSNSPTGNLSDDILSTSGLNVESPASQDGATGTGTWGIDSSGGNNSTRNAALFDFTATPNGSGIGHFGIDLHDFESSLAGTQGELRLYRAGNLILSSGIDWGTGNDGNGESHFLGITASDSSEFFDQVMLVVGDDDAGDFGNRERWAADNISFGQASGAATQSVPEPAAMVGLIGVAIGGLLRKKAQG